MLLSGRPIVGTAADEFTTPHQPDKPARVRRRRLRFSRLTLRILAINVLAPAILVGGVLYLGRYQENLIQSQLDTLKSEAKLFAGVVADSGVMRDADQRYMLSPRLSGQVVRRWVQVYQIRTRIYDDQGALFADSNQIVGPGGSVIDIKPLPPPRNFETELERSIDQLGQELDSWPGRASHPIYRGDDSAAATSANPDLQRALAGDADARAWLDSNGRLLLTAAAPIQQYKKVLGAVLLNRDGASIEAAIRSTRLDLLKVFGAALAVTVLLSLYLAGAIGRPIRRLALAAERLRMSTGRGEEIPDFTDRHDEIGELSFALREMTEALWSRMDATERFAADVAHELKNPLSSLASAVETVGRVADPDQKQRLLNIINQDVKRLDRLISDISNASRLDAELSRAQSQPVDLTALLRTLAEIHHVGNETRPSADAPVEIVLDVPPGLVVRGIESRLGQVFQNLISNAVSFSPPGGTVSVFGVRQGTTAVVTVEDQGPGIPPAKVAAIFDRFYSERPSGEAFGMHSGLGLSIAKQIVETLGGVIRAENRVDSSGAVKGARFIVQLPLA